MTDEKPKPGTYGALTRSTEEEEHKAFMKALNGLFFTKEEFIKEGPLVVYRKGFEVLEKLKVQDELKKAKI